MRTMVVRALAREIMGFPALGLHYSTVSYDETLPRPSEGSGGSHSTMHFYQQAGWNWA